MSLVEFYSVPPSLDAGKIHKDVHMIGGFLLWLFRISQAAFWRVLGGKILSSYSWRGFLKDFLELVNNFREACKNFTIKPNSNKLITNYENAIAIAPIKITDLIM